MEKISIPQDVLTVLHTLNENGYEGYIVGGAVRDFVMQRQPHDWDVTTNAKPGVVKNLFKKTIDTGLKHGTVTAMINGEGYEITTYRADGKYSDGRHPDDVNFVNNINEDLARRDFTINAMAMDAEGNIVDPFGGLDDIKNRVVRCVGNPHNRFKEDALRMLRAVRFESVLNFSLEKDTRRAIAENVFRIENVSQERIHEELTKLLLATHPAPGLNDMFETSLASRVLPEFDQYMMSHIHDAQYIEDIFNKVPKDPCMRWGALFRRIGLNKDLWSVNNALNRLRFSNADIALITQLVDARNFCPHEPADYRKYAAEHGVEFLKKKYTIELAESSVISDDGFTPMTEPLYTDDYFRMMDYIEDGTAILPRDLKIDGNELMEIGLKGREIGQFLKEAYEDCLAHPENNDNGYLRQSAKGFFEKMHDDIER